jgi:uncharacterized membrane protein HdeD (DUF308 family)
LSAQAWLWLAVAIVGLALIVAGVLVLNLCSKTTVVTH